MYVSGKYFSWGVVARSILVLILSFFAMPVREREANLFVGTVTAGA